MTDENTEEGIVSAAGAEEQKGSLEGRTSDKDSCMCATCKSKTKLVDYIKVDIGTFQSSPVHMKTKS